MCILSNCLQKHRLYGGNLAGGNLTGDHGIDLDSWYRIGTLESHTYKRGLSVARMRDFSTRFSQAYDILFKQFLSMFAFRLREGLVWLNVTNFSPAFSPPLNGKEMD